MYDFVVVGCGPPGARFARRAAQQGHDVIVFENEQVGEPLARSGHVSADIWEFTGPDAREELFQNEIRGARFHVEEPDDGAEPAGTLKAPADVARRDLSSYFVYDQRRLWHVLETETVEELARVSSRIKADTLRLDPEAVHCSYSYSEAKAHGFSRVRSSNPQC